MDTPQNTLLIVLQVVSSILTLLMFGGARQTRRSGVGFWVAAFAIQAASQFLREFASLYWGHNASLPIGHLGGPFGYAVLYIGVRRYLGLLPQTGFAISACVIAVALSIASVSNGMNFISLALTASITGLFQALTTVAFWRVWQRDGGLIRAGAAMTFAVSAVTSLARAISIVPDWNIASSLTPANTTWLLVFIALIILQAGSLLFLLNQTLLDELQSMADYDTLTGLLNRGGLSRRMQRQYGRFELARTSRIGLLCMDLDHFKSINDSCGHGAGDDVLQCIGKLIRDNSRPGDIPARQGGEEFAVIVEAGSDEELKALGERMRAAVEVTSLATRTGPISVTISIGAALAEGPGESWEGLGERADRALFEAKRAGRNRVVLAGKAASTTIP